MTLQKAIYIYMYKTLQYIYNINTNIINIY